MRWWLVLLLVVGCRQRGDAVAIDADGDGVPADLDCDDTNTDVSPGGTEACNGVDDDCDGQVDEGDAVDAVVVWLDADADGFGTAAYAIGACGSVEGFVDNDDDCDDADDTRHPDATEACTDLVDLDCDGVAPGVDADRDGVAACEDCDDTDRAVFPGAPERCNGEDDDCDGPADEDAIDAATWYDDTDDDGAGDPATTVRACDAPEGFVATADDCDPTSELVHPGADESCTEQDEDCDGDPYANAVDAPTWFVDADGDAVGGSITIVACAAPTGFVGASGDCDDLDANVYPGAPEICDGKRDDCTATGIPSDELALVHPDADGDGHGDAATSATTCDAPDGWVASSDDCDDLDGTTFPGATEACDGVKNDCAAGAMSQGELDRRYVDADGDQHGTGAGAMACAAPGGWVAASDDCDDVDATVYPGAVEACDGVRNDCDGTALPGELTERYADRDADGHGDPSVAALTCAAPAWYVAPADDCDDTDPAAHPGHPEVPANGTDDDCAGGDGSVSVYVAMRRTGDLVAVDRLTGAVRWTRSGLGEMTDVEAGPDGTAYASQYGVGVVRVTADGATATPLLADADALGLFFDREAGVLLVAAGADVLEVDPSSGAVSLFDTVPGRVLVHVARVRGQTFASDALGPVWELAPGGPARQLADLGEQVNTLVPAADGSLFASVTPSGRVYRVDPWFRTTTQVVGPGDRGAGMCADPLARDGLLYQDHVALVRSLATGTGDVETVASGLAAPWGCATDAPGDRDLDGFLSVALGGEDCDDTDPEVNPDAGDVPGDGFDANCDRVDGVDGDGDRNSALTDCDDQDPGIYYGSQGCPGTSCKDVLARNEGAWRHDGEWFVTFGGPDEVEVYCDQTTDGGGWTGLFGGPDTPDPWVDGLTVTHQCTGSCGTSSCQGPPAVDQSAEGWYGVRGYRCGHESARWTIAWPNPIGATDVGFVATLHGQNFRTLTVEGVDEGYVASSSSASHFCAYWNGEGASASPGVNQCSSTILDVEPRLYVGALSGDLTIAAHVGNAAQPNSSYGTGFNLTRLMVR